MEAIKVNDSQIIITEGFEVLSEIAGVKEIKYSGFLVSNVLGKTTVLKVEDWTTNATELTSVDILNI